MSKGMSVIAVASDGSSGRSAERERIRSMIEHAGVAILINTDSYGGYVGRPMLPLLLPQDPSIYFLTHQSSRKVRQLDARPQVAVTVAGTGCYVVAKGSAWIVRDP